MSYNVAMDERYRLLFRGDVLEGQHTAVVKKRLGETLSLSRAKLDELFSGKTVILSKSADAKTTAKLQGAFKKCGAKLLAVRVKAEGAAEPELEPAAPLDMLPVGSDVLSPDERVHSQPVEIDTEHLAIDESEARPPPAPDVAAPDVSHISVADVGEDISEAKPEEVVEIDVEFDLAEVGSLVVDPQDDPEPAIDVDKVDFDVAEPGTTILEERDDGAKPAPDTSHIKLDTPE